MTLGYEREYQLRTGDFDKRAEILPSSLLDIFQDIAGVDADQTPGMTSRDMEEAGVFWAITQTKYEIVEMPAMHQVVLARTWSLAPNRLGFQREYTVRGADGTLLVKGTSTWVMMNRETRDFVSARSVYRGPTDFSEERNFDARPRRIRDFEAEGAPRAIEPAFTDIDLNGHVNNTKYANFFLDAWNPEPEEHVRSFQIDYRHEIRAGESVEVFVNRAEGEVVGKGVGADGTVRFFCKAELA